MILDGHGQPITPEVVIAAYRQRCFPMADAKDGPIFWYRPARRAVVTWDRFKIPDSLRKTIKKSPYRITCDVAFAEVITACADRSETWISPGIIQVYAALHAMGVAHSIEAWQGEQLVGGCYGLAIDSFFAGESMFHRANDAAKICVAALIEHLQRRGFALLDCQQQTPHMERFGAREISDAAYGRLINGAKPAYFAPWSGDPAML